MLRGNFEGRKTVKRTQAAERQAVRNSRTANEQLEVLSTRPGESKRERARLA